MNNCAFITEQTADGISVYAEYRGRKLCLGRFNGYWQHPASFPPLPHAPFYSDPDGSILRNILLILGAQDPAAAAKALRAVSLPNAA